MKVQKTLLFIACLFIGVSCFSQSGVSLPGIWKGTSICQVKNSPCHDENAVYHIYKPDSLGHYGIQMNKMVNGKEEEMGLLDFIYNSSAQTLISRDEQRNAEWKFIIKGNRIEGTLMYKNQLYRIINVTKQD
jgi:hypothetical protein